MIFKKNAPVYCPVSALFDIMQQDLELGICCDITFFVGKKKHVIGVYGDDGETHKHVYFYFDKSYFRTMDALKKEALLEGIPLVKFWAKVKVTECDGCYPRSSPILESYYEEV